MSTLAALYPIEQDAAVIPPVPESLDQTGLPQAAIEHLILKLLYLRGEILGRDLSNALGLRFSLIDGLMESMKRHQFVQVKRSLGMGNMSSYFSLSEMGRNHALQHLEANQYAGPVPVPLDQYTYLVRRQRLQDGWRTKDMLAHAYRRIVVTPKVLSQLGPAVSSGNSFLLYGQPGNGKTYLAEALANLDQPCIYMPYAIEYHGTIVQL